MVVPSIFACVCLMAAGMVRADAMRVWLASVMDQVRPLETDFSRLRPADTVRVRLACGEAEGVLIAVAPEKGAGRLSGVSVTCGGLAGEGAELPASSVACEVVGYVNCTNATIYRQAYCVPCATNACGYVRECRTMPLGWYADPILPFLARVDVDEGTVQSFLVRVRCPDRQKAGTYRGELRVSAAAGGKDAVRKIPFEVRVNGFHVGRTSELPLLVSFTPYVQPKSLTWTDGQADELRRDPEAPVNIWRRHREEWADFLASYFIMPVSIYAKAQEDGPPDFDLLERVARKGRLGHFSVGMWKPCRSDDDSGWRRTCLEPLKRCYERVRRAGLADKAVAYGCDETSPEGFASMQRALAVLKREIPGLRFVTTAGDPLYGVGTPLSDIDWFVPLTRRYVAENAAAARVEGRKVLWYVASGERAPWANFFVDAPLSEGRILMGAQAVRMRPDGFLYYAVAKWNKRRPLTGGPFTDWDPVGIHRKGRRALNGDGVWAYCGQDGTPVATLRLENFRDGVEDYNYAKMLERRLARHADSDDAWAREARALLAVPLSVMESMTNFTDRADAVYAWRDRMADLIEREDARLRVQRPFATSGRHLPKKVMGREYWTYIGSGPLTDPAFAANSDVWRSPWNDASLTNLPVFRDCALVRHTGKPPPDAKGTKATWRTVQDNCGRTAWEHLASGAKGDRPFVLVFTGKRNVLAMTGDVDLDHADWAAFKAAHTNLVGTRTMCEWGNDIGLLITRTPNVLNEARRAGLEAVWRRYDRRNRYDSLALCRWYTDRKLEIHYGDPDTFMAFRGLYMLDHVAAAWGAKTLTAETTNTSSGNSEYRWDVSGMFVRGAARQFGLPWCWYEANFFNGPAKDGSWQNNSVCGYRYLHGNVRPEGGTSASAQRRCWFYAYLNGANAVEPESWGGQFFTTNTPAGKAELSGRGRNFSDFHDFTAAHPDRGVTYAPVAILVPFAQGYTAHGGAPWLRCPMTPGDRALDALFFTIAPGWERAKALKEGRQDGNLHNSRFAMMYDVLVPDSPQPKGDFAEALRAYPAAILVGDYPDPSRFEDVLDGYVRAGGRLIRISPDNLPLPGPDGAVALRTGRMRIPSIERILEGLQRDLFPFEVAGDCQYGANRTADGWWLWVFNNRGVHKFADTAETIDHSKDAEISVSAAHGSPGAVRELVSGRQIGLSGGRFTFTVPAGDLAVFDIRLK